MQVATDTSPATPLLRTRRRWPGVSDWAGFVGHAGIAVLMIVRAPWISLFLIPSLVHMFMAAVSFLVRDEPKVRARDPLGRVFAYAGGFGVFAFVQVATVARPEWLTAPPTTCTFGWPASCVASWACATKSGPSGTCAAHLPPNRRRAG